MYNCTNIIVDKMVQAVPEKALHAMGKVRADRLNLDGAAYRIWLDLYIPDWKTTFTFPEHKKLLEFYISYAILDPKPAHVFMDAAGGVDSYLPQLECRRNILQDIKLVGPVREKMGKGVELLECNAGDMPLVSESVDRISVHHSFEHFCGTADTDFIREVQRLLAPGGKCCIVPIFLANLYAEITDDNSLNWQSDPEAKYIIDPTSAIPGGAHCGHFARVYDVLAFKKRVLDIIDMERFNVSIFQITLDGEQVPDMTLDCHAHVTGVNSPYRAFVLEKSA